jgi:hypothetical protein
MSDEGAHTVQAGLTVGKMPVTSGALPFASSRFTSVSLAPTDDRERCAALMASHQLCLHFQVANQLAVPGTHLAVSLQFTSLSDFAPLAIIRQVAPLAKMQALYESLTKMQLLLAARPVFAAKLHATLRDEYVCLAILDELHAGGDSRLEPLVQEAGLGVGEVDLSRHLRHGLAVVIAHRTASRGEAPIAGLLAELDAALSAQVREIIDHPQFQQLQRTWRELHRHCEHFAVSS